MPGFSERRVEVTNPLGLHLRVAGRWVQCAEQFRSEIRVTCNGYAANGKSILDLLALGAGCGAWLEIETSGPDSEEAIGGLCELIEKGIDEDEVGDDCSCP